VPPAGGEWAGADAARSAAAAAGAAAGLRLPRAWQSPTWSIAELEPMPM
jgi:hypothetical protein